MRLQGVFQEALPGMDVACVLPFGEFFACVTILNLKARLITGFKGDRIGVLPQASLPIAIDAI
jgi:hypothetical protein